MQAIGFPGAFANAAKIGSQCRWEDADDPVVADRQDKLDRFRADMAQRESNRMQWLAGIWVGGALVTIAVFGIFIRLAI